MNDRTILERAHADEEGTHRRIAQLKADIVELEQHLGEIKLFRTMLAVYMGEPDAGAVVGPDSEHAVAPPEPAGKSLAASIEALRDEIRKLHQCDAVWVEAVPVVESARGEPMWEGEVHVFDLVGLGEAQRAYAWMQHTSSSQDRQLYVMLHRPPVDSPQMAVRASIVGRYRSDSE